MPVVTALSNNRICRQCGSEEETSVHILCECEGLAWLGFTQTYTSGSFFMDPEDIRKLSIGAIWNCAKGTGAPLVQNVGHKGPVLRPRCIGPRRAGTQIPFNSVQFN